MIFTPLMTCYLTDSLDADELERGFHEGVFTAAVFTANVTTNSKSWRVTRQSTLSCRYWSGWNWNAITGPR